MGHLCPGEDCIENEDCESMCCVDKGICDIRGEGGMNCSAVRVPFWGYALIAFVVLMIIMCAIALVCYLKK